MPESSPNHDPGGEKTPAFFTAETGTYKEIEKPLELTHKPVMKFCLRVAGFDSTPTGWF